MPFNIKQKLTDLYVSSCNLICIKFYIYLSAIFILRLAPFYTLPLGGFFSSSHTIAYLLICVLFLWSVSDNTKTKSYIYPHWPILLYLLGLTCSILSSMNVVEFLRTYKNYILALMLFFISIDLINTKRKLTYVFNLLIVTTGINIATHAVLYFRLPILFPLLQSLLYDQHWISIQNDMALSKYFMSSYDDALVPILLYNVIINNSKGWKTISLILLIGVLFFFVITSNYRIAFVVAAFGFCSVLFLFKGKKILFISIVMSIFILFGYIFSNYMVGYSSIDRLFLTQNDDIQTIYSRFDLWRKALEIGSKKPFFGVGLSNFYDNLNQKQWSYTLTKSQTIKDQRAAESSKSPHNIFFQFFAETGLLGISSLIVLLVFFVIQDWYLLKKRGPLPKFFIISFWGLFVSSLTGPRIDIVYQALFWLLRGLIIKSKQFDEELERKKLL